MRLFLLHLEAISSGQNRSHTCQQYKLSNISKTKVLKLILQYTFVRSIVIISPKPCMAVLEDLDVKKGLSVLVCGQRSQNKTCFPIIAKNESRDLSLCFDELTQPTPAEPGSPQVLFSKRTGRRGGPVRVLEVLRQSSRQSLGKWL